MSEAVRTTRREQLAALLAEVGLDVRQLDIVAPSGDDGIAPCSFVQRAIWLAEQARRPTVANHLPLLLRITGPLDRQRLDVALRHITVRHDILRTTIWSSGGVPVQSAWPAVAVDCPFLDIDPGADPESAFIAAARAVVEEPFDPSLPFPWRVALFSAGPVDHCLAFSFHHLVFDGASIALLAAALVDGYRAGTPPADDAGLQYADFSIWQHVLDRSGRFDDDIEYWVRELADMPSPLSVGGDLGSQAGPGLTGDTVRLPLDSAAAGRLHAVAQSNDTTTFVAGLAAWAGWLAERSGEDRLLVVTPLNLRSGGAFSGVMGPVINTVPLHVDAAGASTYTALVRQVREKTRLAVQHRHAPIERVLARLRRGQAERSMARVAYARRHDWAIPQDDALPMRRIVTDPPGSQTEASLELDSRGGRWSLALRYSSDVFSRAAAARALSDFAAYLADVTAAPDAARRRRRSLPLTATQGRMWADQQRTPDAPLYNVASALDIEGPLDRGVFARAFDELVRSADAMRLGITLHASGPRQTVSDDVVPRLEHLNLASVSDTQYQEWLRRMVGQPFDLRGPLVRSALVARGTTRHTWLLVQHHLVTDGWSVRLLCQRMSDIYRQLEEGRADLGTLSDVQGVPQWMDRLSNARADGCADPEWWLTEFEGVGPLPLLGVHPSKHSTRVTRSRIEIAGDRAERIRAAFSETGGPGTGVGAFALTAAAVAALLYRLTGAPRIALGVAVHRRPTREDRSVVGLFMDVVPVTVDCGSDVTIATLADRAARSLRRSLRHGEPPAAVRERACDLLLNVQASDIDGFAGRPARIEWISSGHERESLALHVHDAGRRGIGIDLDTHDDVFDARQRADLVRWVRGVAEQCAANPGARVRDITLTDAGELREIVECGIGPSRPDAPAMDIAGRVLSLARTRPDSVAVECGPLTWTYGELADQVHRGAGVLHRRGIGPGDVVVVGAERRPEFVATLLAVLAVGGAWFPVEAGTPAGRVERLLADARPGLAVGVDDATGCDRMTFEALLGPGTWEVPAAAQAGLDAPAYLVATSGSTGVPKLVQVPRRALSNYVAYACDAFALTPADRVLQFASLAFDTAVEEIFPTLATGAALVLRDDTMIESPRAFVRNLGERHITVLNLPTSYWHDLVASHERLPASVRLTLVGGSAMRADLLARWRLVTPDSRLLNGYGPTETTVVATFADLTTACAVEPVPIGRPIWNCELLVIDGCGAPAPIGAAGELYIAGAGLANGYRGDPALTARMFTPHPLDATRRAYRTGDRVRLRNGTFEYLGRLDDQLKIRGFRVAPEEIVARLRAHPAIADATVVADSDGTRLRAYVVVAGSPGRLDAGDAKAFLRRWLPEYMIPAEILQVATIPRTASGKVDRAALTMEAVPIGVVGGGRAPATPTEQWLSEQWLSLTATRPVDADVNFFDIGGHSLLAAQVVARASAQFGVNVPLRAAFEHPTIRGLAAWIDAQSAAPAGESTPADKPSPLPIRRLARPHEGPSCH